MPEPFEYVAGTKMRREMVKSVQYAFGSAPFPSRVPGQWRWIRQTLAVTVVMLFLWAASGRGVEIDGEAMARARQEGQVAVVVLMREPAETARDNRPASRGAAMARMRASVLEGVTQGEVEVRRAFEVLPGFAAMVSPSGLERLSAHPNVVRVDVDREGSGGLAVSVPQIEADRVQARGITGEGTVVAVLDTGVDSDHPDLVDGLIHEECFCSGSCCPDRTSRQSGPGSAESRHDHGVHVTGILLSRGRVSAPGVAPGASLVAIRVLNDQNRGSLSDWIAGLDWIAANRHDVRVVNMSLVSDALFAGDCDDSDALNTLFAKAIDLLRQNNTLVFAAAGNNARPNRLTLPACIRNAISVSSVNADDEIAFIGNSGPNLDLLAPGVEIESDAVGGSLTVLSGTSMASPHAAGVAALLFSAQPGALASLVESVMEATGVPIRDVRNDKVTPRVAALAALTELDNSAEMLLGGGSEETDCLLEWNFIPPSIARDFPRAVAVCTDGDPSCDTDGEEGRCTFELSLCFNMTDPRLPRCEPNERLSSYEATVTSALVCAGDCDGNGVVFVDELINAVGIALGAQPLSTCPAADADGNGLVEASDLVKIVGNGLDGCHAMKDLNAYVLEDLLPSFPIVGTRICSVPIPIVVMRPPGVGARGLGAVRMSVRSATRRDYDRIVLICEPGA
jgi:hypothetical protein